MMRRLRIAASALYVTGIVVTFGHAAAHHACTSGPFDNPCATQSAIAGAVGAVTWPLYWSWQAWQ